MSKLTVPSRGIQNGGSGPRKPPSSIVSNAVLKTARFGEGRFPPHDGPLPAPEDRLG
jgi:hypothetical protein